MDSLNFSFLQLLEMPEEAYIFVSSIFSSRLASCFCFSSPPPKHSARATNRVLSVLFFRRSHACPLTSYVHEGFFFFFILSIGENDGASTVSLSATVQSATLERSRLVNIVYYYLNCGRPRNRVYVYS